MAASDQVAGYAPQLATLAAQVNGDPGAISTIAGIWTTAGENTGTQTQAINQAVRAIQADWHGAGADSFTSLMNQFSSASSQVEESLKAAGKALQSAATTLQDVQTNVEGICQDLASEVASLQSAKTKLTNLDQLIQEAASHATGQAKAEIQKAERDLETVISDLTYALSQAEHEFSALPVPSGGSITPSFSTDGTAVPLPSSGSTTALAGGSPGQTTSAGSAGGSSGGSGGAGGAGGSIPGVTSGSGYENELEVAKFLVEHGYSKAAAAGIAACIAGESSGNPEAVGDGGFGLIGWTPQTPGQYADLQPTGNASADLSRQMAGILTYNNANGNIGALNSISNPVQAADYYSQNFERPLVTDSDVRANVATAIFQALGG
jgi:WXG100 family type VII secretion target